jgi:ferric-dicitrate binding protein FerR (iron transport regulator)
VRALPAGHVVALGTGGGQVSILSGRVWLTSGGDPSDHVLDAGETFDVRDSGPTLVETWSRGDPAVIAWRPRSFAERLHDRLRPFVRALLGPGQPDRRAGIGTVAAVAAVALIGAVFEPLSEARLPVAKLPLPHAAVLHNADRGVAADATRGAPADGAHDTGYRTPGLARQADRRAPGAA